MNIFFGKISKTKEKEQIEEGYYRAPKESSWFNGIQPNDYSFIVGGDKIQLWQAQEWTKKDGDDILQFKVIHDNLGITTKHLPAIKYFTLKMELIVLTVRPTASSKMAFFPIEYDFQSFTEDMLTDIATYENENTYRKIHILDTDSMPSEDSIDIQLYKENDQWKLFKSSFISQDIITAFRDNTKMLGHGRSNKDKTITTITSPTNSGRKLSAGELSILQLYDLFCCDYREIEILDPDDDDEDDFNFIDKDQKRKYWIIAPGENARLWERWQNENIVAIGWDKLGDLNQYKSKDEIARKLQTFYDKDKSQHKAAYMIYAFFHDIQPGDIIFAKKGTKKLLGYGVVESDYIYAPKYDEYHHVRNIKWIKTGDWDLPENTKAHVKTLTGITNYPDYLGRIKKIVGFEDEGYDIIRDLIDTKNPTVEAQESYSIEQALESLFFERQEFEDILEVLRFKKNIILQGAPGVGKTYIAKRLAYALMKQEAPQRVQMIQFHQSYSYEDFIQGYRPNDKENFTLKNGVFYEFCKKAQRDPENIYVFIIDEINRGNLGKIFGELMMLIEPDKRGQDYAVPLTYAKESNEKFYISENLYLIGTMNTADRSLAMVDYALRRRFSFISLLPKYHTSEFKSFLKSKNIEKDVIEKIVTRMTALNVEISKDEKNLGIGYQIGHSFFCPTNSLTTYDNDWYQRVVRHEIKPLLEEYWFDNLEEVNKHVKTLLD